jgi:hypothetical protein
MDDQTTQNVAPISPIAPIEEPTPPIVPQIEKPQPEVIKTEEIKIDLPLVEEAKTSPVEEAVVVIKDKEKEIGGKAVITIRSEETGDKVYVLRDSKRYWIRNPESLIKMGFRLGQEKTVPFSELLKYPEGEPLDLTPPDAVYPWDKPEVPKSTEPTAPYKIWN